MPIGWEYAHAARWNAIERLYIRVFGWVDLPSRIRAHHVAAALRRIPCRRLLDIGSGTGSYAFYFARDGECRVWGIDPDPSRVADSAQAASRSRLRNVTFLCGEVPPALGGFESGSIDVVLAIEVLQYVEDLDKTLLEICRLLRPGGCLAAHVPIRREAWPLERRIFSDAHLREQVAACGLEALLLGPTMGPAATRLCAAFKAASTSRVLTAILFPVLLLLCPICRDNAGRGDSRILIARKPLPEPR